MKTSIVSVPDDGRVAEDFELRAKIFEDPRERRLSAHRSSTPRGPECILELRREERRKELLRDDVESRVRRRDVFVDPPSQRVATALERTLGHCPDPALHRFDAMADVSHTP
jgi:hypothetical protein